MKEDAKQKSAEKSIDHEIQESPKQRPFTKHKNQAAPPTVDPKAIKTLSGLEVLTKLNPAETHAFYPLQSYKEKQATTL